MDGLVQVLSEPRNGRLANKEALKICAVSAHSWRPCVSLLSPDSHEAAGGAQPHQRSAANSPSPALIRLVGLQPNVFNLFPLKTLYANSNHLLCWREEIKNHAAQSASIRVALDPTYLAYWCIYTTWNILQPGLQLVQVSGRMESYLVPRNPSEPLPSLSR